MNAPGTAGPPDRDHARGARFLSADDRLIAAVFILVIVIGIYVLGHVPESEYSVEARQRASVTGDLLAGLSRGREGLIGSLELPPLPTVAMAILALIPFVGAAPVLGCVVAGGSGAFLAIYMNRTFQREGVGALIRYPCVASLLLLPPVAISIQLGQSAMVFVALVLCGGGFLLSWLRERSLRDLAYAAVLLGLAVSVRYQAVLIVLAGLVVVALAVSLRRPGLSEVEGTCLTFLAPCAYVVLLWVVGNWLILGNPLFFLRGLIYAGSAGGAGLGSALAGGCEWALLAAVAPLVLSVPLASFVVRRGGRGAALRHVVALGGLGVTVLLAARIDVSAPPYGGPSADPTIPSVVRRLEEQYPNGAFVVIGYEGYEFMEAARRTASAPERRWVHLMRLKRSRLEGLLRAFEGRDLYVVVSAGERAPRPERWEEVGLDWRGIHSRIPERFLFTGRIDSWLLFECLRER